MSNQPAKPRFAKVVWRNSFEWATVVQEDDDLVQLCDCGTRFRISETAYPVIEVEPLTDQITVNRLLETLKAFRLDCLTDMEGADGYEFEEAEHAFNAAQYIAERLEIWPQLQAREASSATQA